MRRRLLPPAPAATSPAAVITGECSARLRTMMAALVVGAAALAPAGPANADAGAPRAAARKPAANILPVKLLQKAPCGNAANLFFCAQIEDKDELVLGDDDDVDDIDSDYVFNTAPFKVRASKGARVMVTWNGTVYCQFTNNFPAPGNDVRFTSISVFSALQIQSGASSTIQQNGEGAVTVGTQQIIANYQGVPVSFLYPVSLTRVFTAPDGRNAKYFLRWEMDFRQGASPFTSAFCNLNGGAMTALVVP